MPRVIRLQPPNQPQEIVQLTPELWLALRGYLATLGLNIDGHISSLDARQLARTLRGRLEHLKALPAKPPRAVRGSTRFIEPPASQEEIVARHLPLLVEIIKLCELGGHILVTEHNLVGR